MKYLYGNHKQLHFFERMKKEQAISPSVFTHNLRVILCRRSSFVSVGQGDHIGRMLEALDAYGVGGVRKSIIQISPAAVVTTNRPAAGQKSKSLSMTSSPLKRRQVTGVAMLSGSPCDIFIRLIFACHWPATLRQATCH